MQRIVKILMGCALFFSANNAFAIMDAAKVDEPEVKSEAKWVLTRNTSMLDGRNIKILGILSDSIAQNNDPERANGEFYILCEGDKTHVVFTAPNELSADQQENSTMTYQFGQEPAQVFLAESSEGKSALGFWGKEASISNIKQMFNHDKMTVKINAPNKAEETLEFSIGGLEEKIKPLREACNW